MKFASFEALDISLWRMGAIALGASALAIFALGLVVGDALGQAKTPTLLVMAALVCYIVVSAPRRILDRQRVAQARESLLLSAAGQACLGVTGSRSKTFMLIRPRERALATAAAEAARRILLGTRVRAAVVESSRGLASYSAVTALRSLATMKSREFEAGDEESRGLATSSELIMETKLPMFMTVCFFAPIMIILYAVFSHTYGPEQLTELGAFEFAVLDLAYFFSSADRSPG
jgi:hypothetical protein